MTPNSPTATVQESRQEPENERIWLIRTDRSDYFVAVNDTVTLVEAVA